MLLDANGRPQALYNSAAACKCGYASHRAECLWGDGCRSFSMAARFL